MNPRRDRLLLFSLSGAGVALLLAGCVPGPPSADQVAGVFDDAIEPAWSEEVPGIYGEPAVADGFVAVYAKDEEDGLRLEVRDVETGELAWEHVASPNGTPGRRCSRRPTARVGPTRSRP
jgi:hypothetical protein